MRTQGRLPVQLDALMVVLLLGSLMGCGGDGSSRPRFEVRNLLLSGTEDTPLAITFDFTTRNAGLISLLVLTPPSNGTLQGTYPTIQYQPRRDFSGSDTFLARLVGNGGQSGDFTVTISVAPVNDPPTITGTPLSNVVAGSPYSFVASASDVDSATLVFQTRDLPPWLVLTASGGTARLQGTPTNADARLWADIVMSVTDGTTEIALPPFSINVRTNPVSQLQNIPSAKRIRNGCAVSGNYLYSFGGVLTGFSDYDPAVWRLDLSNGQWDQVTTMPEPIIDVEALTTGGQIVLLGGFVSTHPFLLDTAVSQSVWHFDPILLTWTRGADRPDARREFSVAAWGTDVYLIGGIEPLTGPFAATDSVMIYDTTNRSWRDGPALPLGLYGLSSTATLNRVVALGGRRASGAIETRVYQLDPMRGEWSATENPELSIFESANFRTTSVRDEMLVLEVTQHDADPPPPRRMFSYDPVVGILESRDSQAFGGKLHYCVTSGPDKVYVLGGTGRSADSVPVPLGPASPTVWEYDPALD